MEAVKSALLDIHPIRALDDEILSYIASIVAEAEPTATGSPEALELSIGPFLDAFGLANSESDLKKLVNTLYDNMVKREFLKPISSSGNGIGGRINAAGLNAATAASLRALMGEEDEEQQLKLLSAPVKISELGTASSAATIDFLWGRDNNAFLNQNQVIDYSQNVRDVKRAAKREDKLNRRENSKATSDAALSAAQVRDAIAKGKAITSGSVTYVPVVERKAQDIHMTGINLGYGGELLFEDCELHLVMGRTYGLVGRNGYGKSTLLRHMAHHDIQGAGAQQFPKNIRVLYVEQEIPMSRTPVLPLVLEADVERDALLKEEQMLQSQLALYQDAEANARLIEEGELPQFFSPQRTSDRLTQISERLDAIDSDSAESRAAAILNGLGFTNDMFQWPMSSLSGGWRMRVALACALFVRPDVLLLDEPTNHLDVPSCMWLEMYLEDYPNTCVVVSHDRRFLDAVCTDIIHLHSKRLDYYKGDYATFERTRAEKLKLATRTAEAQEAKRAHVQEFIDRFRYNAKRASLVQSRIKALERMEQLADVDMDDPRWHFTFPSPSPLSIPILQVNDIAFGYNPTQPLFRGVNFGVDLESRIAIVGPNGSGKSTLLKLLLGELEPQAGFVNRNAKLRVSCFTQHHVAQLDMGSTPLEYLMQLFPGNTPESVRAHLSNFGIVGDLALQRIGTLSGGQKSRVAFAVCSWRKPHLMVLDEPTNHLDIETIDALIIALGSFEGGVVVVSHDAHFIESVASELWVVGEGKVSRFRGEFKDYRKVALGDRTTLQAVE